MALDTPNIFQRDRERTAVSPRSPSRPEQVAGPMGPYGAFGLILLIQKANSKIDEDE